MPDRVRMNTLCLAAVALGQGPMFWHAGTDLLRSKSLDRNSFDSGDWFNRIDWTGTASAFGSGLPPAADNQSRWPCTGRCWPNPALVPGPADIAAARAAARPAADPFLLAAVPTGLGRQVIIERVSFPHGGPAQPPGVIVMVLSDQLSDPAATGCRAGADRGGVQRYAVVGDRPVVDAGSLVLHPVQVAGVDPVVRLTSVSPDSVTVPPRTVAVLQS